MPSTGWAEEETPFEEDPDDAQALLIAASLEGRSALGSRAGRRNRRAGNPAAIRSFPPRCAAVDGYNLHADVHIPAVARTALERLCRYVLRPPLSKARLEERADGLIVLTLKRPWDDGTTEIILSRLELLEKLCALVPPPFVNQITYGGILAGRASWRAEVVPRNPPRPRPRKAEFKLVRVENASESSRWWPWADLLDRVFSSDGLACPRCGGRLRLRAIVIGPPATTEALAGIARAVQRTTPAAA